MKGIRSPLTCHGIISFHNTLAVLSMYHKAITVFSKKKKRGGTGVAKNSYINQSAWYQDLDQDFGSIFKSFQVLIML